MRRLRESGKVVVASVADVAASGGYYIAMGCERIVCDDLSITGSIGVVSAVLKIGELLEKVRCPALPSSFVLFRCCAAVEIGTVRPLGAGPGGFHV